MRKVSSILAALALVVVASSSAQAQRFGAQLSWGDKSDMGLGVRGEFDFANKLSTKGAASKAFIIGQLDYYFIDCAQGVSCTYLEINPSLAVPLTIQNSNLKPYVGGGLHVSYNSASAGGVSNSDTGLGLNVLGGFKFGLGGMDAFSDLRLGLGGDYEQFAVSFGVMFGKR